MKKIVLLIIVIFVFCGVINAQESKIHQDLKIKMVQSSPQEFIPIYIIFNNHLNLSDFDDISYDTPKKERRQIVINRLINFSNNNQKEVRLYLDQKKTARAIEDYFVIWMNNIIALKATTDIINELSRDFSNVRMICYDAEYPVEQLYDDIQSHPPFINAANLEERAIEPGILLMNADD